MGAIKRLTEFFNRLGANWTAFWFREADLKLMCKLRIAVGLFTLLWMYSLSSDISNWFGPQGLAPDIQVDQIVDNHPGIEAGNHFRWSFFRLTNNATYLWWMHLVAFSVACTFTLGLATPVSAALCYLALVSYTHRAPMLFSKTEFVLSFSLLYFAIAASGFHFSLDSHFRKLLKRRSRPSEIDYVRTNISIRLLQIHLSIVYLFSALAKLGSDVWWQGDAVWWLAIQPESSLSDFTGIADNVRLMNFWTHAIVLVEILMATLIWVRPIRFLLVGLSTLVWISLIPLTGDVPYCILMIVLNFAFFDHKATRDDHQEDSMELTDMLAARAQTATRSAVSTSPSTTTSED